jgi:formylglycine-generating enzyme required for sulfatase activity
VLQSGSLPARDPATGRLALETTTAIVLVLIPGGRATVGASREGPNRDAEATKVEGPVQTVRLDPYFLGKFELTQAQWLAVMGSNPSRFQPGEYYDAEVRAGRLPAAPTLRHPAESFTWEEGRELLGRLGLTYPTEAQWEYAARAGSDGPYYCCAGAPDATLGKHANVADLTWTRFGAPAAPAQAAVALGIDDGHLNTAPVGSFAANGFGLHDVLGNVWEKCLDPYDDHNYAEGMREGDGLCRSGDPSMYALRGGGFASTLQKARISAREGDHRRAAHYAQGLRPARPLIQPRGGR